MGRPTRFVGSATLLIAALGLIVLGRVPR